ncbi:LuxR C-terminal-related transcriptional regulator [Marinactinospora thermotolerans]|uniref:Response regulator containing a CheY-like receiver domain and an HTH DNA-binding domain n=1 Tax=Marinactinospora thermotolerans DSM 45154 TaxID=1122192 RepID=A0A1T4R7Z7_9ACTN|nr:LuxR family transcriptional regulator [Marinactinospora thermotolerans]SKA12063.1 Response regulator containing a CheY-like receiver domain and an HTH DNA-binding domain [Marinactinospora thermotolerans DSM 45154]
MLYGRFAELSALDEVIAQARQGCGGAVVLRGEAGAGKTALLDAAAGRGEAMRVLRTSGVESESDLAFAALHQLLWPVAGSLEALPGPQRDAVRAILGHSADGAGDRFLLGAGVLSLLAEAAGPEGLICVVDDFQWADRASADALLFAARRLATERIAMLIAVRGDAPVKGVPTTVDVRGLPEDAAAELLESRHGLLLAASVRRELITLTGANPLALNEIAARLTPAQLAGRQPLPDPLPGGARLFGGRVTALSAPARLVALLAAVEADLEAVLRSAERLVAGAGSEAAASVVAAAFAELEESGLAEVSGTDVRFRHPLMRSAVHEAATPAEVRHVHAALAEQTAGDRRAWHLAGAALGQTEPVALALAEAAARARDRGGYGAAATALSRAAELTPGPRARAVRLKDAAVAAWLGGRPGQAESLLAEARERAEGDTTLAMEIAQLRGRFELNSGNAAEAVRILAAGDTLDMLADAVEAASYVGDTAAIVELGRRAAAHPEGFLRDTVAGIGLTLSGDPAGPGLLRRALARAGELEDAAGRLWATAAASALGESDLATEMAERAGRVARVSGMTGQLPVVLEFVATADRLAGRLSRSQAVSEEGLALAREAGYENTVAAHLANLAVLAALRGEAESCERQAREALAIAIPHRVGLSAGVASYALALLELCLGRFAAAHDRFTAIAAAGPGAGHPTVVWRTAPDRVEAAVGAGDEAGARAALSDYERSTEHAATSESRALLARCRGLAESSEDAFGEALRLHTNPFEAARTALLLGERLRRAQRPGQARAHLRMAWEIFEQAGARPWARRAREELRAAGESGQAPPTPVRDALSPQELRIAGLVADGLSSKQIAARLFLSPRTVEYHLYKIYPKLGISSRTELARLVVLQKASAPEDGML